jgi:hypothetical protein
MRYRIKPGSLRVNIPALTVRMSAEVDTVPADPIDDLPVINTVNWSSFIHRYCRITKPDGRIARAFNTVVTNGGLDVVPLTGVTNGDPGLEGRMQRIEIEAGDTVTVYNQRVPVVAWSRIDGTTFKKKWREEFNATYPQTLYPPPQPNIGTDRYAKVDPTTGLARLTFTVDPKCWSGGPGDVLWNLPDTGATLVVPYALTDLTIEVDFEPGQYEMVCVVTDMGFPNEPLQRAFRNVYIEGEGFSPFSSVANITAIEGDRTDLIGRSLTLVVRVDKNTDLSAYLYAGASVLLTYQVQEMVAGVWTNQSDSITAFKGYLAHIGPSRRVGGKVEYRLLIENPLLYFRRLGIASQVLQRVSPPTTWLEVDGSLSNIAFVIYYLLEFNAPSLVQYVDVDFGDFESFVFPEFSFTASSLTSTAQVAAGRRPLGNVGCTSGGTITLRDHPAILSAAQRAALGSKYTWTARRVREGIEYERNPIPALNRLRGNSFAVDDSSAYVHEANLYAPGYGAQDDEMPDFLALTAAEAAEIVGRMIGYEARPTLDISWTVNGMIDVTDPPEMIPHTMNMEDYDPLAGGIYSNLVIPISVERTWKMTRTVGDQEVFDPRFDVTITAEPETDAPDAPERIDPALGDVVDQDGCAAQTNIWTSVGATPTGWAAAGIVDTTGWSGDTTDLSATYSASRSANQNWTNSTARTGLRYTPPDPCAVTGLYHLFSNGNTSNSKRVAIAVRLQATGVYHVLTNVVDGFPTPTSMAASWSGTIGVVDEILYLCADGAGAITRSITECRINT